MQTIDETDVAIDDTPSVEGLESPAAILRHAAVYLWRCGWTRATFYHQPDPEIEYPFPPACTVGAIRAAVFGKPMPILYDTNGPDIDNPHHQALVDQTLDAQRVLAALVDPDFDPETHGSMDVIAAWNDETGRRITDVLTALYGAADDWDAAQSHAAHTNPPAEDQAVTS
jgi:hypothetical protein